MTFTPTLALPYRYWELSRAASRALNDRQRAEIWSHWTGGDPLMDGTVQAGYWKLKPDGPASRWVPVAIWPNGEYGMLAMSGGSKPEIADRIWSRCGRNPISYEDYTYAVEHGKFPGEIDAELPAFDHNAADPNAAYREQMVSLLAQVESFLKTLPDPVTEEGANALINYKDAVTAAQKQAKELLDAAIADKKAAIEAEKSIWKVPMDAATEIVDRLKALAKPFLLAAAERGEDVKLGGQGTGTGRPKRTSLRTVWKAKITDWGEALHAFHEHEKVKDLVQQLANAAARDKEMRKEPIAGVEFIEEKVL